MIRKAFFFVVIFLCSAAIAQITISKDSILARDSIVRLNELKFDNLKEKDYYLKYLKSKEINDAVHLLFYGKYENSNVDSIIRKIDEHVGILRSKMDKLSEKKKMKFLYTYIHNNFFDKYVELALFPDIFTNKEYNCLSASILYGYFLEKLRIPYEARLSNTHVYLVAYPKTLNIILETTNPVSQIGKITDDTKRQYVNQMRSLKLIGSDEFEKLTVDELFSKYYYKEEAVNMYEMVGAHYLNRAAGYLFKFSYSEGYNLILKGHVINPSYKTIFSILQTGVAILQQDVFKKPEDAEILGILSRFNNYGITNDMIIADFNNLSKTQLIEAKDTTLYINSYNKIINVINDSALKSNISEIYYDAMCRHYYKISKIGKSLEFAEKMFILNPNRDENEDILIEVLTNYIDQSDEVFNDKDVFDKIQTYVKYKPSIEKKTSFFGLFIVSYWINLADKEYSKGKMDEGDKYLEEFEKIITPEQAEKLYRLIQDVYVSGSFHYYKKYNNKKAKEYIERGLKILPDNYELNRRLKAL